MNKKKLFFNGPQWVNKPKYFYIHTYRFWKDLSTEIYSNRRSILADLDRKKNCFRLINKFKDLNPMFIEKPVIKKFTYLTKKSLANLSKG